MTRSQWRYCAKVGLAAALGFMLTQGSLNQYSIYSSFTAALVVGANVGEDMATSVTRAKGTVVGMVAAMVISFVFGPHAISLGLAVTLTAALALFSGWGIPVARVGVTVCIITLALYGDDVLHYDLMRAGNTAIGIVVGLAVSFFVFPVHATAELRRACVNTLSISTRLLDALEANAADLRPLQSSLHDALASVVKNWRDTGREKRVRSSWAALENEAVAAMHLGLDVLSCSMNEQGGGTYPALRQRIAALERSPTGEVDHPG